MPVTAKLSRKFYEKFGDELTNELVDWFNQVDATYRGDLRELNELNFARFDAKLDQRVAGLDARLEGLEARLDARMAAFEARIIKWMFLFWVGQAATTVGLVFGVVRLIGR
jgi:hypothetical protein